MRLLVVALVLATLPATALAQNGAYLATVTDAEVRVRAGQSEQFRETSTLKRGMQVVVDHEELGGWLAIQAPPGSVSWVQMHFIEFDVSKPKPENAIVTEDVTLAPGRVGETQPLSSIRRTKVPAVGEADGRARLHGRTGEQLRGELHRVGFDAHRRDVELAC